MPELTIPLEVAGPVALALCSALGLLWKAYVSRTKELLQEREKRVEEREKRLQELKTGEAALTEINRRLSQTVQRLYNRRTSTVPPPSTDDDSTQP